MTTMQRVIKGRSTPDLLANMKRERRNERRYGLKPIMRGDILLTIKERRNLDAIARLTAYQDMKSEGFL